MIYTCYKCSFAWAAPDDQVFEKCPTCGSSKDQWLTEAGIDVLKRRIRVSWPDPVSDWPPYDTSWHPAKKYPAHSRHGRIRRFVVNYSDAQVSRKFYENVFDWDIIDTEHADKENPLMFAATGPGSPNWEPSVPSFAYGYLRAKKNDPTGTYPRFVIECDSIDETLKKIVEAGGEILREKYQEDGYDFAMFRDTEGNAWFLWETPADTDWDAPESQSN